MSNRKTIRPGDEDPRHGTANGYVNLGCRCSPCRKAHAAYTVAKTDKRAGTLAPDDPRHGRASTYNNYRCRCDACRLAKIEYAREYRARVVAP